jgi:hypothetical protein
MKDMLFMRCKELVWIVQLATPQRFGRIDQVTQFERTLATARPSVERSHGGSTVLSNNEGQSRGDLSRLQVPSEEERGYDSVLAVPGAGLSRPFEDQCTRSDTWRPAHASSLLRQVYAFG